MGRRAGKNNKHSFPSSSRGYSMQTSGPSKVNRYHAFEEDSSETADATEKYVIKQDSDDDENLEVVEADKSEFQKVESKKQKEINKDKEELVSCFDKTKDFLDKQKQRALKEVDNNKKFNFIALNEKLDEVFQENFFELNFQKLKGKKGCVYSPGRFLHEAKEFANLGRNVIATELVWGAFSCSLCRFYESLKINIESHSATNVLCRILISCHTNPRMQRYLHYAMKCASEAHRSFYRRVKLVDLRHNIDVVEDFNEELKEINKEAVMNKFLKSIENHQIVSEEFGVVQVYEEKHMDYVFGVEGEFDYRVSLPVKHEKKRNYQKFDTNHATNLLRKKRRAIDLKTLEENKGLPKCKLKNRAIYGEEEKRIKARILSNNNGLLTQIVHPSFPKERDWVMVTGIERVVDGVLICSLSYGGRLVSMGHFLDLNGRLNYYAIMHKYNGPVFLKPEPMPYAKLLKDAQENEELDLALTQICGQDNDGNGKVYFSTYWERVAGVNTRIWFPGSPESDMQKNIFEREGFRLINLCGYSVRNRTAHYVGIWQKQLNEHLFSRPYEARYGLTLNECLEINDKLSNRQYVAVQFRVFRNLDEILCCAIWEYLPGHKHWIEIDINLKKMHNKFQRTLFKRKFKRSTKFTSSPILPRQISHFFDVNDGSLRFVVLWSNVNWMRFPKEEQLWPPGSKIPFTYLPGVESNLLPNQLVFVAKRVERFLRELDIPGLSVAISKDEKLKYAAGFGYSNVRRKQLVTPDHQFRIGSVSKPITAAAILLLVDQGHLYLDKRVFGIGNSIFGNVFARKKPYGKWVTEITVRHLLEHTAGGWNNIDSDPAWLLPTKNTFELIEHVITEQPLIIKPGKVWIYSNFGYQLLGYIIEKINLDGLDYEQFVKKFIWEKVGVKDVQLGRPTLSEKARREVLYYMAGGNRLGFNPYDLLPAERMGPWGGWIASPIELLRLLIYLDGFKKREDILSDWAIKEWIIPTIASNETYGLGWSLNIMGFNGWQHDGRMPGSASMLVRLDNGISMAVVVNKEYSDRDFFHELGYILHHFGNNYDWWNSSNVDLFTREVIEN